MNNRSLARLKHLLPEVAIGVNDDLGGIRYKDADRGNVACRDDCRVSDNLAFQGVEPMR